MTEEFQPDPDELLKAIQKEEIQSKSGKLKIFFGMSAGVGKTYSMLEAAQERLQEGVNVVVGTVVTHGRKETEELMKGLPIIPEKWVKYRDTVFEELDLERILKEKPALILVDELAHTNVPGSRHAKRWQDVIELLDAGIDVYTTMNVQHLESRKDLVESIAGIQVRETVPDLVLERATSIELIDIPPPELLMRMKEGKVYLGNQSQIAARNFFKEDTLMALREIALRFTAEKVEHDLHTILSQGKGWKTREKLMVAVSPSPFSLQLIRTARRRAFELDAPLVAVYIDKGNELSKEEQSNLANHLNLARELGAEVVMIKDLDIATGLQRIAKQKNITQVIIGRPSKQHYFWDLFHESLIDRFERENKNIDVLILRQEQEQKGGAKIPSYHPTRSSLKEYGMVVAAIAGLTLLAFFVNFYVGYKSIGLIFLLGILFLSLYVSQGPIFFAAILSTVSWFTLFTPPILTTAPTLTSDIILVLLFFLTSTIIGILTSGMSKQDSFLKMRETSLQNIYEIVREIATAADFETLRSNITLRLESMFGGEFDLIIKGKENQINFDSKLSPLKDEKEQATAHWVFQNGRPAGWSTTTLPSAKGLYLPAKFVESTTGVLVYFPNPKQERLFSMEELNFLQSVAQQLGIYFEQHQLEENKLQRIYSSQIEKFQASIFNSISAGLYKPLNQMTEALKHLKSLSNNQEPNPEIAIIDHAERNLLFIADNLLASAEFELGHVRLNKEKMDIKLFIDNCLNEFKPDLGNHPILFSSDAREGTMQLIEIDPRLIKLALKNILLNAAIGSSQGTPIEIKGKEEGLFYRISIKDSAPSIPPEQLDHVFDKFIQLPGVEIQDGGLGLAIAKSVMVIHQGQIEAGNRDEGGRIFSLLLPLTP